MSILSRHIISLQYSEVKSSATRRIAALAFFSLGVVLLYLLFARFQDHLTGCRAYWDSAPDEQELLLSEEVRDNIIHHDHEDLERAQAFRQELFQRADSSPNVNNS